MKITMLSVIDYAYSGHKLCEAINRHTDHDIRIFTGKDNNPYKFIGDNEIKTRIEAQKRINQSDIIHLKGDWAVNDPYLGLKITHKPIIVTTSGSFARKKSHGGFERFSSKHYKKAILRTSFEPDLLYPEYSDVWTPHPIDSIGKPILWKQQYPPVLIHMPTSRVKKGTDFILKVLKTLRPANVKIIEKQPFAKALEMRKEATIFFDQFRVGFYGNSALEAMQYGIPVAAWISPQAIKQAKGKLEGCPVITNKLDTKTWAQMLSRILSNDMTALSKVTKWWCDEIHSYQSVAKQWDGIYNMIGNTGYTGTKT